MLGIPRDALDPRRAPLTYVLLAVLLVTTITQHVVAPATAHAWLMGSSTDVTNLEHRPLYVLLTSAAWLPRAIWLPYAVVFVVVLAPLERTIGSGWALLVYASGHVGATLLTEVPAGIAIAAHWLPSSAATRPDVGISYVAFCAATAYAGLLRGRARAIVVASTLVLLLVPAAADFDLTEWGHVFAILIGLLWWRWLARIGRLGAFPSIRDAIATDPNADGVERLSEPVSS